MTLNIEQERQEFEAQLPSGYDVSGHRKLPDGDWVYDDAELTVAFHFGWLPAKRAVLSNTELVADDIEDGVYVAGPMTGYPQLNFDAFHKAAADLRAQGYTVFNPAELNVGADQSLDDRQLVWNRSMRRDIEAIVRHCDKMHLLPGWEKSKGACGELSIAHLLGMTLTWADGATPPALHRGEAVACHQCGLPQSDNPHPDAGKPAQVLEVNAQSVCIPCLTLSRHQWARRAQIAESTLADIKKAGADPLAEIVSTYGDPESFGERHIQVIGDISRLPYGTKLFIVASSRADAQDSDYERRYAIKEAARVEAARGYFDARKNVTVVVPARIFDAGFDRGYDAATASQET